MRASVSACACSCVSIGLHRRACVCSERAGVCVANVYVRRSAVRALTSHSTDVRYELLGPRRSLRARGWA
jgi:hypothetical protein